jgi:hypothetical protein
MTVIIKKQAFYYDNSGKTIMRQQLRYGKFPDEKANNPT